MKTERIALTYRLTFTSPFHFGTGLRGGVIHRVVARTADGFLYLPGSTLKGVIRDHCEQLARLFNLMVIVPHADDLREVNPAVDIVGRIFGTRFHPGELYFDDANMMDEDKDMFESDREMLKAKFKAWQTEQRTQVSISRSTRTAKTGMLYTSEYGIRGLRFEGRITGLLSGMPLQRFYAQNLRVGTYPLLLLVAALLSVDRLGGSKSGGGGAVDCKIVSLEVDGQELALETLLDELPALDSEIYALCKEEAAE